jgi:excisionase family DNA binding protein
VRYTLGQAAKATGKTKSTIQRAVKSGKISAYFDGHAYAIDPAELHRVFLPLDQKDGYERNDMERSKTVLKWEDMVSSMRDERERERRYLEKVIQELTLDRDYWKDQVESLRLLSSNQKKEKEKRGILSRVVLAALDLDV